MKSSVSLWLRRCQFPLMILLTAAPVVLMQLSIHAPDILSIVWAFFAACLLLCALCLLLPGRRRMLAAGVSAALLLALGAALLPLNERPLLLLLPLCMIALLLVSLPIAAKQYESEIPPFVYVAGIAIQVVSQYLVYHLGQSGGSPYAPIAPALTAACIGYMFLLLLSMNRISLDNASLARHRLPASMRRFNTVLTLAFMAIALLLAALPAVARGITALWHMLADSVARLSAWLLSLLPAVPETGGPASGTSFLPQLAGQAVEPSRLAQIMEKIVAVLSTVILVGGGLFLLYFLFLQLRRLVRWLFARLKQYMAAASSEYDDEITDTREDGAQRESRFARRARQRAAAFDATPSGRIRQTYARLMRRNPQWSGSSTARENLPESAAALYERARYSDHPVTGEDAERFASGVKKR